MDANLEGAAPHDPFARLVERLRLAQARATMDEEAIAQQALRDRRAWHEALRARCETRGVPRGEDLRRWVVADTLEGRAADDIAHALERRGDPHRARWSLIVLLGSTGVGKTAAMVRAVARHPRDARYTLSRDAALALSERPRSFEQERVVMELRESLLGADLLALDELGTEPAALSGELLNLVSTRCGEGRVTMLAGNLSLPVFTARYLDADGRFASRLASAQGSLSLIDGADLRAPGASR
jgi:hypothetical protein